MLPRMRHKPYGRRFQTRINERDKKHGVLPNDVGVNQLPQSMNAYNSVPGNGIAGGPAFNTNFSLNGLGQQSGGPPPLGTMNARLMALQTHPLANVAAGQYGQFQTAGHDNQHYGGYGQMNQQHGVNYY